MFGLVAPETLLMASLFVTGLLLFISVYFMITLSDLESDYLNSRQCSDKLNLFTWPRLALLALHSVLVIIALGISSQLSFFSPQNFSSLWLLLLSLPSTLWLAYRSLRIPSGAVEKGNNGKSTIPSFQAIQVSMIQQRCM